jgi:protoporphyrin/coproporphyrin ferrochelatase
MMNLKTGVLIVNLGTPDAPTYWAVYRYLKQFLLDGRVIDINPVLRNILVRGVIVPFRSAQSAKGYKMLWTENGSPLKYYGYKVAEGVQKKLGEEYIVELAMRYQTPSIQGAIEKLLAQKVQKIIVFPLFPQYASASTGSVHEEVMRVLSKKLTIPAVSFISTYASSPKMAEVFADNARKFDLDSYDHILFSYHGIPQRHLRNGDDFNHCLKAENCCQNLTATNQLCYTAQCTATTKAIVAQLNLPKERYSQSYQSRLGNDPWTQPYTQRMLESFAKERGFKRLLVFCPAFTADCLETIVEIGIEYTEEFEGWGGKHIDLVPSLNENPKWIDAVSEMIIQQN